MKYSGILTKSTIAEDAWSRLPILEAACNKSFNGYHEAVELFSAHNFDPRHRPLPNQKERLSPLFHNNRLGRFAV